MGWWIVGGMALSLVSALIILRLAFPLPRWEDRSDSTRSEDTSDTRLGRGVAKLSVNRDGLNGVHLLTEGLEAFAARVLLIRAADKCLDIQYYIWKDDLAGGILLDEVRKAAERGVRVRLLLDDGGVSDMDHELAALNAHENIEIRLFNPFVLRWPKMLGYLMDFPRLNRRMHNKSLTADCQATIVGGRNIGDEYFGMRDAGLFADLDVLVLGPIVREVNEDFDRYWASLSAYPAGAILPDAEPGKLESMARKAELLRKEARADGYEGAIRSMSLIRGVVEGAFELEWVKMRMVSDPPTKGLGEAPKEDLIGTSMSQALGLPETELCIVSGYFVPTEESYREFFKMVSRGVAVKIFTNSFDASDVWIVHAGYVPMRRRLAEIGVRIFEMKGGGNIERPRRKLFTSGSGIREKGRSRVLRSSATALHAKTFSVDRKRVFIGSFNFDPRSMHLNTELGFVLESEAIACEISDIFNVSKENSVPQRSWEVRVNERGSLQWVEHPPAGTVVSDVEPRTKYWQRAGIRFLAQLPISWML